VPGLTGTTAQPALDRAVAFVLGLLVVVQLRSQAGVRGLAQLSSQDSPSPSPT
jgi:hypothetical protein